MKKEMLRVKELAAELLMSSPVVAPGYI